MFSAVILLFNDTTELSAGDTNKSSLFLNTPNLFSKPLVPSGNVTEAASLANQADVTAAALVPTNVSVLST